MDKSDRENLAALIVIGKAAQNAKKISLNGTGGETQPRKGCFGEFFYWLTVTVLVGIIATAWSVIRDG